MAHSRMSSETVLPSQAGQRSAAELANFVGDLSDYFGVQLTASRRDMAQAETLLSDAMARLLACLPANQHSERTQGDGMGHLAQAIINMQFQDLVSQLLRRADERLAGLDKLLQELARIVNVSEPAALHAAMQCLGSQTLAPERRTSSSIQQQSMTPGDVELF